MPAPDSVLPAPLPFSTVAFGMSRSLLSERDIILAIALLAAPLVVHLIARLGGLDFGAGADPGGTLWSLLVFLAGWAPLVGGWVLVWRSAAVLHEAAGRLRRLADGGGGGTAGAEFGAGMVASGTDAGLMAVVALLERAERDWRRTAAERLGAVDRIIEALPDPLIAVDDQRRVLRANAAARRLLGEGLGDATADRDLATLLRHPGVLEAVDAARLGGAERDTEFTLAGPIECTYSVRVRALAGPTADEAGAAPKVSGNAAPPPVTGAAAPLPVGVALPLRTAGSGAAPSKGNGGRSVLLLFHDQTAAKRTDQMRADFVANASHELRTPLTSVIGFIETLRGPARDDAEAREKFLGIMHEQATRMARLIRDLMSLSRIEVDEHTPPTEPVALDQEARTIAAAFELKAEARRVRLCLEIADHLPPVLGDRDQLAQVFQNLISNAIKYAYENTDVTVALRCAETDVPGLATLPAGLVARLAGAPAFGRRRPPMVALSVRDHGEGIERRHLARLTERFYRVDPARSRILGGTGLGLAIVKHIVNRHRGRLAIESEPGKGSTFTVYLPAAISPAAVGHSEKKGGTGGPVRPPSSGVRGAKAP